MENLDKNKQDNDSSLSPQDIARGLAVYNGSGRRKQLKSMSDDHHAEYNTQPGVSHYGHHMGEQLSNQWKDKVMRYKADAN